MSRKSINSRMGLGQPGGGSRCDKHLPEQPTINSTSSSSSKIMQHAMRPPACQHSQKRCNKTDTMGSKIRAPLVYQIAQEPLCGILRSKDHLFSSHYLRSCSYAKAIYLHNLHFPMF